MTILILGLVIFLGAHSVRIVAEDWRTAQRARLGEQAWKGLYSLVSLVGFVLVIWGFALARHAPVVLWTPPISMRYATAVLMVISFVLLAAAYVPRNGIKARLHHPMLLGVKVWAFAHLLADGTLAGVVLFGCFLLWAICCFRSSRLRDRARQEAYPAGTTGGTVAAVAAGMVAWIVFAFWLHGVLIGVRPFA